MLFPGRQNIVVRFVLLEDHPHAFDKVAGMPPIALGIEIPQIELILQAELNGRDCASDLTGHECLAASRPLVIEQNSV